VKYVTNKECKHSEIEWIPAEPENNVIEDLICVECLESLPIENNEI